MAGVDTSLTATEAMHLLQTVETQGNFSGATLRIRKLALLFRVDGAGRWGPVETEEYAATLAALRHLRDRGHRLIGLVDIDLYPWVFPKRGEVRLRLSEDLREVHGLAKCMRQHLDGLIADWEIGNEPEIFLRDNAEDYSAALKAFWLGYLTQSTSARRTRVVMAPLAHPPGTYLRSVIANDLLRYTEAYNFHLYGYAEDIGSFFDQQVRVAAALARTEAPGRRWWGRRELPVYLTEVGYGGMFREESRTLEARKRQARWFSVVKHDLLQRRPEVVLAFVLKPYVSPLGREMGLVESDGAGGYTATPALTGWLEPARHQVPSRPLRLPRFHAASSVVPDFLPGAGLVALTDKTGYQVAAEGASGQFIIYNFDSRPQTVEVQWPRDISPFESEANRLSLAPGERRVVPVRIQVPESGRSAAVQLRILGEKHATAHWSTNLRPRRVTGTELAQAFRFSPGANASLRDKLAARLLRPEEPKMVAQGRFLVTDDVEVREEDNAWRITIRRLPTETRHRRTFVELPLPRPVVPREDERFRLEAATEAGARTEVEVFWRTTDGALFGAPYTISDSILRYYERDMLEFSQTFFSRAATEWRIEKQQFISLVLAFRPLTPLPLTITVHRPQILRTERR